MERTQFTFYASIFASASRIKNKAARADFYDAICTYALTGTEPDLDKLSDAAAVGFISARPNLDASRKKAKSGKQGGSKPKQAESKTEKSASEKEKEKEVEKEVEIENECLLSSTATAAEDAPAAAAQAPFGLFWQRYPNKVCMREAADAWQDVCPNDATAAKILAGLDLWLTSVEWQKENGRYIPRPARWLSECRWLESPTQSIPQGATGKLGSAELEAIQQLLKEGS